MKPMTDPMSAPAWPPTSFAIPQLWERVKAMFAVLMREVQSTAALAQRWKLAHAPRRAILCRLVPLEKIVRALLVTEAITYLLMTPQGLKLLASTPKITPPLPPSTKGPQKTTIPMPGWHTIAALQPRIDPRIVQPEPQPKDKTDPASWACRFRVLGWIMPEPDDDPPQPAPPRRSWISTLDTDTAYPLVRNPNPWKKPKPEPDLSSDPSAQTLARRIEALTRVIANPLPAIRRLAAFLAGLPRNTLAEPDAWSIDSRWWWHGRPEYFNACTLGVPAVRAFNRREDPG